MIVVTHPRSGGTKFCADLAKKHDLIFMGELNPIYTNDLGTLSWSPKIGHEMPNSQPVMNLNRFIDFVDNHSNSVQLVNRFGFMIAHKADYILLRKDFKATLLSQLKYVYKSGDKSHDLIVLFLQSVVSESAALMQWCLNHPEKEITWFEDLHPNHEPVVSEQAEGWNDFITSALDKTPIENMLKQLWERSHK